MIEARGLTRFFGANKVVDAVSFTVEKGEVLGFLGPNGAGKSTTMRMLMGYLPANEGAAFIDGHDVSQSGLAARRKVGYLPESAPVYPEMTVRHFLNFVARVRGFSGARLQSVVEKTLDRCFLDGVHRQTVGTLSKGYKQRVCFAQAILHDPPYLIMDEPTDGLDPNQKHEVRTMIRNMGREKAIILSTHILEEVEAVCTRAVIIAKGRIVADDSPEGLRALSALHGAVTVTVSGAEKEMARQILSRLNSSQRVEVLSSTASRDVLRVYPAQRKTLNTASLVSALSGAAVTVEAIVTEQGRLDEVFREITNPGPSRIAA
jgi:ABC-2 type transport system ATP-binding protein